MISDFIKHIFGKVNQKIEKKIEFNIKKIKKEIAFLFIQLFFFALGILGLIVSFILIFSKIYPIELVILFFSLLFLYLSLFISGIK